MSRLEIAPRICCDGEAEAHYRVALDLAKDGDEATEACVLEKLGRVLANIGRFDDARNLLGGTSGDAGC